MEQDRIILLVEDNPDDEALTLRAFLRSCIGSNATGRSVGLTDTPFEEPHGEARVRRGDARRA